jgi:hypothetical protein
MKFNQGELRIIVGKPCVMCGDTITADNISYLSCDPLCVDCEPEMAQNGGKYEEV